MFFSRLFTKKKNQRITKMDLHKMAVKRIKDYVLANMAQPWCCPICKKFAMGEPLDESEKSHIEYAIDFQETILRQEYDYVIVQGGVKEDIKG